MRVSIVAIAMLSTLLVLAVPCAAQETESFTVTGVEVVESSVNLHGCGEKLELSRNGRTLVLPTASTIFFRLGNREDTPLSAKKLAEELRNHLEIDFSDWSEDGEALIVAYSSSNREMSTAYKAYRQ